MVRHELLIPDLRKVLLNLAVTLGEEKFSAKAFFVGELFFIAGNSYFSKTQKF